MSNTKRNARIFSSGVRTVYVGPGFDLTAHRTGVAVLCCAISGSMQLARNPRRPEGGWVTCRTLFVPAGTLHYIRFNSKSIACVYLDPSSEEAVRMASVMRTKIGGLATRHHRETQVVALFEAFLRNTLRPADMLAKLGDVLGFARKLSTDERVLRAVTRMRYAPGDAHSLKTLAAEVGLSPSRLQHLFKICTGVPLRRFRIWNRMSAAIAAVSAGMSLTEAAYKAGFSSSAHFSTSFRAMFGLSPSDLVEAGLEVFMPYHGVPLSRPD
jgi:AraC-like DNA-binding protein